MRTTVERLSSIEFTWRRDAEGRRHVEVRIDGEDLVEIVRRAESASATAEGHPELAGSYVGFDDRVASPVEHLMGEPEPLFAYDEGTEVLVCEGCREPGCWPLVVRIEVDESVVRWTGFSQPHRSDWDYARLGSFAFPRARYAEALRRLER